MEEKKEIKIEKITLNCGTGTDTAKLERAMKLLELIVKAKPIKTTSKRRIPAFGIRPGLAIGCKVTIRGKKAEELLKRLLEAINKELSAKKFNPGSFAFGIKEYMEIPGEKYQRDIGIMGFDVCVTLTRHGFRTKRKKIKKGKIPKRQYITKEETMEFMHKNFNINII